MAVDVKAWLDQNADLYRSIEAAALKQDPGTTQLRVWTRIALDKADELAAQAEPWAADARHAAMQALNMAPTDDGVPSDRYFRRLCRVQALYGVLTHLANPDGQPALNADEHTWRMADAVFEGIRRVVGWDSPVPDAVANATADCLHLCRGFPGHYLPEQHASQAALYFRALWQEREDEQGNTLAGQLNTYLAWITARPVREAVGSERSAVRALADCGLLEIRSDKDASHPHPGPGLKALQERVVEHPQAWDTTLLELHARGCPDIHTALTTMDRHIAAHGKPTP